MNLKKWKFHKIIRFYIYKKFKLFINILYQKYNECVMLIFFMKKIF
jgi:hypothetical protein